MTYYVTPDLGLELADPATVQAFETVNVNDNFLTLEAGIVADRVRLAALEGNLKRVADLTALAVLALAGVQPGTVVEVGELRALFMRNFANTAWEQVTPARFATSSARDTAYAKAAAAFRVDGATSILTTGTTAGAVQAWRGGTSGGWRFVDGRVPLFPAGVTGTGVTLNADGSVSFSAATSIGVRDVFSAFFRNYEALVVFDSSSAAGDCAVQLGSGTTPVAGTGYSWNAISGSGGTVSSSGGASTDRIQVGRVGTTGAALPIKLFGPQTAQRTFLTSETADSDNIQRRSAGNAAAAAHTSLFVLPSSASTGRLVVYGIPD